MKAQADSRAEIGKILFVEKRRERLHGACKGIQKAVVLWVRLEIGFS
jgi:hypothetical protein